MKKVLLLSLSLVLGFSAFAQQRVAKNELRSATASVKKPAAIGNEKINASAAEFAPKTAKSVVVNRFENWEDAQTMQTYYDLQSNSWISNRMYQMPNGSVAVAATMSHDNSDPNGSFPDRGTGYNFFNAATGEWQEMPEEGAEGTRTGWPSIARWGETGEILISHAPLRCWTREVAGEGEWVLRGTLPPYPDGFAYPNDDASWPRIATSGPNHNIIHVIADIQHSVSSDEVHHYQVYYRSEDAENWTCIYSPLAQDGQEVDHFTADSYNIAANGHNVAMIYSDDVQSNVVMYKSTNDGQTWHRYDIWQNPYDGCDWENDDCSVFTDTLYTPASVAIAIDNFGVTHVAMSVYECIHEELGNTYTTFSGRLVDGIRYWNDTQEYPIQDTYHPEYVGTSLEEHFANPNPHHALRMWWPEVEEGQPTGYVHMEADSTKWIGYLPMFEDENGSLIDFDNEMFFREDDYFYKIRSGLSAFPAFSIDPMGNIACAFSAPNTTRVDANENKYKRSIFVSYYNVDEGYWHQVEDQLDYHGEGGYLPFLRSENIFTNGVNNVVNPGEFWFSFQSDSQIGCWVGSNAYQTDASENTIHAVKVNPDAEFYSVPENHDAINPMTSARIYPNPVVDQMTIEVNASQASEMSISVYNLMGQKVMDKNVSINTGINAPTISTSNLSSGVYFVTVKANGFENTMKFIVK